MAKKIVMKRGAVNKISRDMHVTRQMVSNSIAFKKNSELARKIRYVATSQYGGVEVDF